MEMTIALEEWLVSFPDSDKINLDHLHPTCSSSVTTNCLPPPFDGNLLQIMPRATFRSMTDEQLLAIWTYLSAIPCIDNTTSTPPAGAPNELRNTCR